MLALSELGVTIGAVPTGQMQVDPNSQQGVQEAPEASGRQRIPGERINPIRAWSVLPSAIECFNSPS